jgi:hypothetical protein
MEEVDFNVMNKEISEPLQLEVGDIILKFKYQKAPWIDGIMAEWAQVYAEGYIVQLKLYAIKKKNP